MKKCLLASIAMSMAVGLAAVNGQSALDGSDPNANEPVCVVIVQPDGKILLGGDFTTLSAQPGVAITRKHIARLILGLAQAWIDLADSHVIFCAVRL